MHPQRQAAGMHNADASALPRRTCQESMNAAESPDPSHELLHLAQLVVKQGVGLGGLPPAQQVRALGLVWVGLPSVATHEAGINQVLKAQLAGPAAFLDTDHVELRRWLVDCGCLQRDGYGRAYLQVPVEALPATFQPLARVLQGMDMPAWVEEQRSTQAATRAARRAAWEERARSDPPGAGG